MQAGDQKPDLSSEALEEAAARISEEFAREHAYEQAIRDALEEIVQRFATRPPLPADADDAAKREHQIFSGLARDRVVSVIRRWLPPDYGRRLHR
jgi:hypothetical protein